MMDNNVSIVSMYYKLLLVIFLLTIEISYGNNEKAFSFQNDANIELDSIAKLSKIDIEDVVAVISEKNRLKNEGRDWQLFYEKLFVQYLKLDSLEISDVERINGILKLAIKYDNAASILEDKDFFLAQISDQLFSYVSYFLQSKLEEKEEIKEHPQVLFWASILSMYQYNINFPIDNVEKGFKKLEEHKYRYILNRVWEDHTNELIVLVAIFCLGVVLTSLVLNSVMNRQRVN